MGWFLCKGLYLWKACYSFLCKYCKHTAQSWASLMQSASDAGRGFWMMCVGSSKGGKWDANPCFGAAEDERDVTARHVLLWCCTDRQMCVQGCACAAQLRPCRGIGCWRPWLWVRAAPLCLLLALGFHCCLFCHEAEMPVPVTVSVQWNTALACWCGIEAFLQSEILCVLLKKWYVSFSMKLSEEPNISTAQNVENCRMKRKSVWGQWAVLIPSKS